jgi:hypothetical protein
MHVSTGTWGPGPSMAAGYVTVGLGSDLGFGGSNDSTFGFASDVSNATVSVDGNAVVTTGQLAFE